jgi:alpha-mannosidase
MAALLEHVLEYEVVDGAELALTLLRSTGLISRNENPWREDPAGPEIPVPGAQLIGPHSVALALFPYEGSWADANVLARLEEFQHPFVVAPGTGETALVDPEAGLTVSGDGVAMSSLRRRGGWAELRLVCQHPDAQTAVVTGKFAQAREVDLRGRPIGSVDAVPGELSVALDAWQIRTFQLR